jgi:uncharacterized protein (TIGR02145 family)
MKTNILLLITILMLSVSCQRSWDNPYDSDYRIQKVSNVTYFTATQQGNSVVLNWDKPVQNGRFDYNYFGIQKWDENSNLIQTWTIERGIYTYSDTEIEIGKKYTYHLIVWTGFQGEGMFVEITTSKQDQTVSDIDGNIYHTVTIGTQTWMVENLKTTRYRNGEYIGTTNPATLDISGESAPKYQWAYDGNDGYVADYGRLYTWYAAIDSRGVCPAGWHVPSDAEWTTLTNYLGGENVAGGKLKEAGFNHWFDPNSGATNESGFTSLPGGYRDYNGTFYYIGNIGYWWSSTDYDSYNAWYRFMSCGYSSVFSYNYDKSFGFSVRCLRD